MKLKASLVLVLVLSLGLGRPVAAQEPPATPEPAPPAQEPAPPPAQEPAPPPAQEPTPPTTQEPAAPPTEDPTAPTTQEPKAPDTEKPQTPPPGSRDSRRTLARYFPNYARGIAGVFSKYTLKPLAIAAAGTGTAAFFDDNAHDYFFPGRRARWLGDAGEHLGRPIVIIPMALALYGAGRLQDHQRFRDGTYDILVVTAVTATFSEVLKVSVGRKRPDGSNKLSFPSGHASNAFAWATIGGRYFGWKLALPGYTLASLVAISRVEKNVHNLSDVVAGAGLGYICGRAVVRKNYEPLSPAKPPRVTFSPIRDPHGEGLGLQASLNF
jgi:PAP2 superfamily